MGKKWTKQDIEYLEENWGNKSVGYIARKLNRTEKAIETKVERLGLGSFLENGDYITLNQLLIALGRGEIRSHTKKNWMSKGLPVKHKKIKTKKVAIIYINDFWKWAKKYRTIVNFAKLEENILGKEPTWVKEQRKADVEALKFKKRKWTPYEDKKLMHMVKSYRYTYKEISRELMRTECAIEHRISALNIKERPLKANIKTWTKQEINTLIDLYNKGYLIEYISDKLKTKSAMAVKWKIELLLKQGILTSRCNKKCS